MSHDSNVYYHPETYGLTTVGEIEWSEPCYDFDLTVVWRGEDGTFYWASDSGCSCPSPFEDYNSLDELDKGTAMQVCAELQDRLVGWDGSENTYASAQVFELISTIRSL